MGVSDHHDLESWQLADRVRQSFIELTRRTDVRKDLDFCDETGRAARSACRNIAEGFYRFGHREFAHFLTIARGSLGELLDSVDEARHKGYLTTTECETLQDSIRRAMAATAGLRSHLASTSTPPHRTRTKARHDR